MIIMFVYEFLISNAKLTRNLVEKAWCLRLFFWYCHKLDFLLHPMQFFGYHFAGGNHIENLGLNNIENLGGLCV